MSVVPPENIDYIYTELEIARENLNRRWVNNNNDQSAGRSARAILSAMRLIDAFRFEGARSSKTYSDPAIDLRAAGAQDVVSR